MLFFKQKFYIMIRIGVSGDSTTETYLQSIVVVQIMQELM